MDKASDEQPLTDQEDLRPGSELAAALGISDDATWTAAASALASLADARGEISEPVRRSLTQVLIALQRRVRESPGVPFDRALIAHLALTDGADKAGPDAIRATRDQQGEQFMTDNVRGVLYSTVVPNLAKQGLIRLVGLPVSEPPGS
jgi:hypothetical protein